MIYLATDHAGFALKEEVKSYLVELGMDVEDMGAHTMNPDDDYPDFIALAAHKVTENPESMGIVFGGSGQGEAMVANKVKGVRAAVYYGSSLDIVSLSRQHNNANILSLGARFVSPDEAKEAVRIWLKTGFEGGRHQRRVQKIE